MGGGTGACRTGRGPRTVAVERLRAGDHACLGFDSADDRWAVRAAFAAGGLARGERVMFFTGPGVRRGEALDRLAAHGLRAEQAAYDGRLEFVADQPGYEPGSGFDADARTGYWTAVTDESLALGFTGLRAAGDMAWAAGPGVDDGAPAAYESGLTPLFAELGFTGLCEYDRRVFAAPLLGRLLAAHPLSVPPDPGALHAVRHGGALCLAGAADLATRAEFELSVRESVRAPGGPAVIDLTGLGFLDASCARAVLRSAAEIAADRSAAPVAVVCTAAQYRLLTLCGAAGTDGLELRVR